jgi:hypothetical protein
MKNFRYEIWVSDTGEASRWTLLKGRESVWENRDAAIAKAQAIADGYALVVVDSFAIGTGTFQQTIWTKTA